MRIRQHRGSLAKSMDTATEIAPTRDALLALIRSQEVELLMPLPESPVVKVTYQGFDARIGWDTHLIAIEGWGVYGQCDGPFTDIPLDPQP